MLLRFARNKCLYAFIPLNIGSSDNKYDRIKEQPPDQFYTTEEAKNMTGWQRLRDLFRLTDDDIVHPAVVETIQNAVTSLVLGGMYGAIIRSKDTFIKFVENNEATLFRNHLDAKRKLSDAMLASYFRGFMHWGTKVSFFVTTFTASQLAFSVYQNKHAFWHYSAGGATAGALYKFPLGPKGMVSGAFFGGFFGTLYGIIKVTLLTLTNQTEHDVMMKSYNLKKMKDEYDLEYIQSHQAKKVEEEVLNST